MGTEQIHCQPSPDCKYWRTGCFEDTHHIYWPRHDYRSPLEREFRGLPEHQIAMCRAQHDELHATDQPPDKPSAEAMRVVLNGVRVG